MHSAKARYFLQQSVEKAEASHWKKTGFDDNKIKVCYEIDIEASLRKKAKIIKKFRTIALKKSRTSEKIFGKNCNCIEQKKSIEKTHFWNSSRNKIRSYYLCSEIYGSEWGIKNGKFSVKIYYQVEERTTFNWIAKIDHSQKS